MSSYLLEFEESNSGHMYCKNVGMFEFLFLPALPSFMCMRQAEDATLQPVFVPGDESKRHQVIEEVHRGVLDFCRDVIAASAGQPWLFDISKNDAVRTFARFVQKPSRADAQLLDGVSFVDAFGGAPARYLIATPFLEEAFEANMASYLKQSWWRPGAQAIVDEAPIEGANLTASLPRQVSKQSAAKPVAKPPSDGKKAAASAANARRPWERKLRKFLRDPHSFALDTKVVKSVRKLLRPAWGSSK
jgi:hypothetical protein